MRKDPVLRKTNTPACPCLTRTCMAGPRSASTTWVPRSGPGKTIQGDGRPSPCKPERPFKAKAQSNPRPFKAMAGPRPQGPRKEPLKAMAGPHSASQTWVPHRGRLRVRNEAVDFRTSPMLRARAPTDVGYNAWMRAGRCTMFNMNTWVVHRKQWVRVSIRMRWVW